MHKSDSEMAKCNVDICENEAERTIGRDKIRTALVEENLKLDIKPKITKVKLCKEHYRRVKKYIKKDNKIERARWQL